MNITAKIINPFDKEEKELYEINLIDLPTAANYVNVDNKIYKVIRTLFKKWGESLHYNFEQIIAITTSQMQPPQPHFVLLGKIVFENLEEANLFFKDIRVRTNYDTGYNAIDTLLKYPYYYMRKHDIIEMDNRLLVCDRIIVVENIEIIVDPFQSPSSLTDFREDKNYFVQHNPK